MKSKKLIVTLTASVLLVSSGVVVQAPKSDTFIYDKFPTFKEVNDNYKSDGVNDKKLDDVRLNVNKNRKTFKEIMDIYKADRTKKLEPVRLKANKDKNVDQLIRVENIEGYVNDDKLRETGEEYKLKLLMTYEESYNKGYTSTISFDVDPGRMVWVTQLKHSKDLEIEPGKYMKKPLMTNICDAETGEVLDFTWQGN